MHEFECWTWYMKISIVQENNFIGVYKIINYVIIWTIMVVAASKMMSI